MFFHPRFEQAKPKRSSGAMLHAPTESQLARHREATNTNRMKIQQAQLARIRQSKLRTYRSFGRLLSVSHVPSISRDVVGSHGSISKEAPGTGNHLVIYSPALLFKLGMFVILVLP